MSGTLHTAVNECYNQISHHTLTIQCQVPSLDVTATPAYRHITFTALPETSVPFALRCLLNTLRDILIYITGCPG